MSRLLFAAARGARIESEYHNWSTGGYDWREANLNNLSGSRIHPDDEHLQYGPISSALHEAAENGRPNAFTGIPNLELHTDAAYKLEPLERSLFLLILAEALADEGL